MLPTSQLIFREDLAYFSKTITKPQSARATAVWGPVVEVLNWSICSLDLSGKYLEYQEMKTMTKGGSDLLSR